MKNSYFFYFFFILFFVFCFYLLSNFGLNFFNWNFVIIFFEFLNKNQSFYFVLAVIVMTIFFFSKYYMQNDLKLSFYFFFLLIFIFSMVLLNFSLNSILVLVSWDLLGVSSFFLVLFYNNWDSNSGALNTVLTNRLGDFFLFIYFIFFFLYGLTISFSSFFIFMYFFIILGGFTKSAIFPFSGWLPKAMSAPTPISALVHSSTLVTAGLFLLMKFEFLFKLEILMWFIFVFGLMTMFFSSLTAFFEVDMKKVIALSTLSQMGFMMMMIGLSMNFLVFLHLVSHALFKSLLFMQMGFIMHNSNSGQDCRFYNVLNNLSNFMKFQMLLTLFCLTGLFFTSGLVSKDMILEMLNFYSSSIILFMFFIFVIFMTFFYCLRLMNSLMNKFNLSLFVFENTKIFNFLGGLLFFFSLSFIWFFSKNFFFLPLMFLYYDIFLPLIYLVFFLSLMFLLLKIGTNLIKFSFLVDFFPKLLILFNKKMNSIFFDLLVFKFNYFFFFKLFKYNLNFLKLLQVMNMNFIFLILILFIIF